MNNKDGEAARISKALRGNTKLSSLDICVTGFTQKGAKELADGIRQSNLTSITFSGHAADEHAEVMNILYREGVMSTSTVESISMTAALGDVDAFVHMLPQLKRVKFWSRSALHDRDTVSKLASGLAKNESLQEMYLYFDNPSYHLVHPLLSSLAERSAPLHKLFLRGDGGVVSSNNANLLPPVDNGDQTTAAATATPTSVFQTLKHLLDANKCPIDVEVLNVSASPDWSNWCSSLANTSCTLSILSITKCSLSTADARSLGEALSHNTSIHTLRLVRNELGDVGLKELAQGLAVNKSIQTLQLANNKIGDTGITNLVEAFQSVSQSSIQQLEMMNNVIGPMGARKLVTAALCLPSLVHLNLANNECIGMKGLKLIGECLPQLKIQVLDVSLPPAWQLSGRSRQQQDDASNSSEEEDAARAANEAGKVLAHGLEANYHIHELSVSGLNIPPQYLDEIKLYTDLNKCGRHLLAEERPPPPALWCHIMAKCHGKCSLLHYLLLQKPDVVVTTSERK